MLYINSHATLQIDHIVLGKGPPGGAWHRMDPNLRTLSLSAWMSLPGFDFPTWEQFNADTRAATTVPDNETPPTTPVEAVGNAQPTDKSPLQRRNLSLKQRQQKGGSHNEVETRALISRVAAYYEDYVREMGLSENFWNDVTVTNVFPVRIHGHHPKPLKAARWMVVG